MANGSTEFQGKIELDIRDSEPDWGPYAAPTAPRERAEHSLSGVGRHRHRDLGLLRRPGRDAGHDAYRRARCAAVAVPHHRAVLTDPGVAADRSQRHHRRHGHHRRVHRRFPQLQRAHPRSKPRCCPKCLAERGYNTYCVGKWHLTPLEESSMASTKRHWPTSRGFERFYGFMGGETDQWYPDLVYDNHPVNPPGTPEDGYHLSKDIADKTIEFIRDAKVIAPDKPWFSYVCPGAGHAPHHVFKEWADRYAGSIRHGLRAATARSCWKSRRRWGSCPRTPNCRPSTRISM